MSSQTSTENNTVEIDNNSILNASTPKALGVPSADKSAKESKPSQALDEMVEALDAEIEQTKEGMRAVWEEIAIENGKLYTIQEWI
ncbi:hypothetical protein FVEN_g7309 [Fusarium venenatum]|uniref:Uncharacterized protein n=1 Tax=Fusarium venenatum TaxID=56646 RepID=A0A2L2U497_9HYPO|nr:uncharacterized protein FVRRES_09902 [Fusarium venenatum]KAG8354869.1 hypothetical protein FVEN_g7309 [Fusarium venenatum]CEI69825.1 unnamed protein product [Fusarium venenatum]